MRFRTKEVESPDNPSEYLKTPWGTTVKRPEIDIELLDSDEDSLFDLSAIIDSGADITMVNAEYALSLGVSLHKIPDVDVKGVTVVAKGKPAIIKVHLTKLGDTLDLPVLFIDKPTVNILLGREVFFQRYKIRFCISEGFFEIKRISG